jgi:hypothetical protein
VPFSRVTLASMTCLPPVQPVEAMNGTFLPLALRVSFLTLPVIEVGVLSTPATGCTRSSGIVNLSVVVVPLVLSVASIVLLIWIAHVGGAPVT